ncbi:MAG TPA: tetratricopeptide repeat protein [Pedococcus sp.]|jgi:Flp pilus assembly protein TadD|nr:tetratricopeptide repeat protein [Pedococcus sp.]
MTTMSAPFALRLASPRSLFDHGDPIGAARALADLVVEAREAEVLHDTTELRMLLARAYFGSTQLGRAESVLRELVAERPTDGYVHLLLGRTLQRQGRHDDARQHLTLAEVLEGYERPSAYGERKASAPA